MKSTLYLTALLCCSSLIAQDEISPTTTQVSTSTVTSRKIELLPGQKQCLVLRADERNPYARRAVTEEEIEQVTEGESEEDILRRVFESLTVTGVSRGRNGLRALVGDMILERGYQVPQMIANQTEFLIVTEVAENEITLAWIDKDKHELTGKELSLTFDLDPRVRSRLAGQLASSDDSEEPAFFERRIERERKLEAIARGRMRAPTPEEPKIERTTAVNGLDGEINPKGQ